MLTWERTGRLLECLHWQNQSWRLLQLLHKALVNPRQATRIHKNRTWSNETWKNWVVLCRSCVAIWSLKGNKNRGLNNNWDVSGLSRCLTQIFCFQIFRRLSHLKLKLWIPLQHSTHSIMPSFPFSWPHLKKGLASSAAWEKQTNLAICTDSHKKSKLVTCELTMLQLLHLDFSSVAPSLQQLDCLEHRRKSGCGSELRPVTMQLTLNKYIL